MFHFKFHVSPYKTLRERLLRSHSVFESLPQCFELAPTVFLIFSHSVFNMKR